MSEAAIIPIEVPDAIPPNLVEVGSYRTYAEGAAHGLVVLALRQPYWLLETGTSFRLLVEPAIADAARHELACFDRESIGWPPRLSDETRAARGSETITPLLWSLLILTIFRAELAWPALVEAGVLDTRAIFDQGEWWRVGTALMLHADPGHAISNAFSGIAVFGAVVSTLGTRRGWLLVLLAALAGNFAVAAVRAAEAYRSLGASTAIFAGLGLLTGHAIRRALRSRHPHRWRSVFVPFAAGTTILALYGAGGLNIDVGAHVAGFVGGLGFGYVAGVAGAQNRPPQL